MAAEQADAAIKKVEELVGGVIDPMETMLSNLKSDSEFMNSVKALSPKNDLVKTIESAEFQGVLKDAHNAIVDLGSKMTTGTQKPKWQGGSRRKRVKRRASTRAFYRKRRY